MIPAYVNLKYNFREDKIEQIDNYADIDLAKKFFEDSHIQSDSYSNRYFINYNMDYTFISNDSVLILVNLFDDINYLFGCLSL